MDSPKGSRTNRLVQNEGMDMGMTRKVKIPDNMICIYPRERDREGGGVLGRLQNRRCTISESPMLRFRKTVEV